MKKQKNKGITLVALVITIIVIIILATVAINFVFGENGLITRAQQAKLEHEIETARETLTMVLGDAFVEKKINPEYDPNGFLDEFIKKREPNVYLEDKAIGLDGHVFDLDRSVPELGKYQGELTGPRIQEIKVTSETTNSASIEVVATNAEDATYEYWYKNDAEGEEQWKKVETDNKSNTCTIEGLTQGEIYNIRVIITTEEGSTTGEQNVYLGEIPEGTITLTPAEWVGDGTAKTTINTTAEGFALQYQIVVGEGQIDNEAWQPATPGQTIDGLHHNETVYGRLFDGTNESKVYATTTVKDEEGPEVSMSILSYTPTTIEVIVESEDNESGLYSYRFEKSTDNKNFEETETVTNLNSNYTYKELQDDMTYYIRVIVTDKANNQKVSETLIQKTPIANTAPTVPTVAFSSKTNTALTVTAQSSDVDGNDLTYTLYAGETSGNLDKVSSSTTVAQGQTATITLSGLDSYVYYYWRVDVSDGVATTQGAEQSKVKTYCYTTLCSEGDTSLNSSKCELCGGGGIVKTSCSSCRRRSDLGDVLEQLHLRERILRPQFSGTCSFCSEERWVRYYRYHGECQKCGASFTNRLL